MNTLLIIAVILLVIVSVAMSVVLRFDRRQNKIVDAKLISEVEKNGALEQKIAELNKAAHAAELRIALLEAENNTAVIPVVAPIDSYRIVEGDDSRIIDRSALRMVQTPQVFQAEALRKAYEQPFSTTFTDDASVMEAAGHKVTLVEGERENIKITTPSDMLIAEAIINAESETQL